MYLPGLGEGAAPVEVLTVVLSTIYIYISSPEKYRTDSKGSLTSVILNAYTLPTLPKPSLMRPVERVVIGCICAACSGRVALMSCSFHATPSGTRMPEKYRVNVQLLLHLTPSPTIPSATSNVLDVASNKYTSNTVFVYSSWNFSHSRVLPIVQYIPWLHKPSSSPRPPCSCHASTNDRQFTSTKSTHTSHIVLVASTFTRLRKCFLPPEWCATVISVSDARVRCTSSSYLGRPGCRLMHHCGWYGHNSVWLCYSSNSQGVEMTTWTEHSNPAEYTAQGI